MRKILPLLFVLALVACKNDTQNNLQPAISMSFPTLQSGDTLWCSYNATDNTILFDTITPADTISFAVSFDAISNNLTAARINADTTHLIINTSLSDQMRELLLPTSDTTNLNYHFPTGYRMLIIPLTLTPNPNKYDPTSSAITTSTTQINLIATSDSSNPTAILTLTIPITSIP